MQYSVGDVLQIKGELFNVVGIIQYRNLNDNCDWFEYRLISHLSRSEKWLSVDTTYNEFSISWASKKSTTGYEVVDAGNELVINALGDVDVIKGDKAYFMEHEDATKEKIISIEKWDNEIETSEGYYIEENDIILYDRNNFTNSSTYAKCRKSKQSKVNNIKKIIISIFSILIACWILVPDVLDWVDLFYSPPSIQDYVEESPKYEYTTSITGSDGEKANVYKSTLSLDATVKDIINGIEGDTENVQQNTEDRDESVALLTDKEYSLVYMSEKDEVLVQISTRKYAYHNDNQLYHSHRNTRRFYRRYYYSKAYRNDCNSYSGSGSSPYSSFDDSTIYSNGYDSYNTYSYSVRQSSIDSRRSSGGGLSGGK